MFKNINFKSLVAGFILGSIFFVSVNVLANQRISEKITVVYDNIKINLNGGEIKNMDVEPFIHQNRTFIPVRFVAEELNMDVRWNEQTKTVELKTRNSSKTEMAGEFYDTGIKIISIQNKPYIPLIEIYDYISRNNLKVRIPSSHKKTMSIIFENGVVLDLSNYIETINERYCIPLDYFENQIFPHFKRD